ncbi:531_t:CDS:2 [Funneliformis caledonium]|uniref:531_t:CDS:1 n=1 Tax=Funneliformis caledonium TaxID=1117310 RepID=A0A9N9CVE2_9GLOM|nr:531_t:CDS:2 [Funneliformis caledonium]
MTANSQNFEDNLNTTNLDSDSEHKPDVKSSSLSRLGDTSSDNDNVKFLSQKAKTDK